MFQNEESDSDEDMPDEHRSTTDEDEDIAEV